jgi:hypothetical protein
MGACESGCFTFLPDRNIDIISSDYRNCDKSPEILPITFSPITNDKGEKGLSMRLKNIDISNIFFNNSMNVISVSSSNGVSASVEIDDGIIKYIKYILPQNVTGLIPDIDYGVGDEYGIDLRSPICNLSTNHDAHIYFHRDDDVQTAILIRRGLIFKNTGRPTNLSLMTKRCNIGDTNKKCNANNISYCDDTNECALLISDCPTQSANIRVPAILIKAQTNTDGSDLGDATFIICDEIQYYEHKKYDNNLRGCRIIYIKNNALKTTKFQQGNLYIVSVLKGKGSTACEKLSNVFIRYKKKLNITFLEFVNNIMIYVTIRYILSKILFGDFNMNYLLGKYYNTFLKDLGKSRFCSFVEPFLDCNSQIYGYDKYFKFDI